MKYPTVFTKFFLLFIFLLTISNASHSQKFSYNLDDDRHWVDSMKHMVKRDDQYDPYTTNGYLRQLRYFNNCITLGQYYEKLFQKQVFSSNQLAVDLYKKVTDFGTFPDDERFYKAAALRNNLCRKLAAIYFAGKGVKKNRNYSLALALKGSSGYDGFYEYYSMKYYKCNCPLLRSGNTSSNFFEFLLNPFYEQRRAISVKLMKPDLEKIGSSFRTNYSSDTSSSININAYALRSMSSQARTNNLVQSIIQYFVDRTGIPRERIIPNTDVVGGDESHKIQIFIGKQ